MIDRVPPKPVPVLKLNRVEVTSQPGNEGYLRYFIGRCQIAYARQGPDGSWLVWLLVDRDAVGLARRCPDEAAVGAFLLGELGG